jgi:hypothetical protein
MAIKENIYVYNRHTRYRALPCPVKAARQNASQGKSRENYEHVYMYIYNHGDTHRHTHAIYPRKTQTSSSFLFSFPFVNVYNLICVMHTEILLF